MAFPTTPVLDTFSGTLGSWTTPIFGDQALTITGGQVTSSSAVTWGSGAWTAAFGADQEVYFDVPVVGATECGFHLRIQDTSSSIDAYVITWAIAGGNLLIEKYVNGTPTTISTGVPGVSYDDGDKLGASVIGTTITVYHSNEGADFTVVRTVDDSGISGGGQIGFGLFQNAWRADNFGGGEYVPPAPPTATVAWLGA